MTDASDPNTFRTLRGFLDGEEPEEENYFHFTVSLRIHGDDVPFKEISQRLGVEPTMARKKGERKAPRSPAAKDDAWHYQPDIPETELLDVHINALMKVVEPHVDYIKSLKTKFRVDVFCGYRSNCDMAGLEVPHTSLKLFTALEVPFGLSIIIA